MDRHGDWLNINSTVARFRSFSLLSPSSSTLLAPGDLHSFIIFVKRLFCTQCFAPVNVNIHTVYTIKLEKFCVDYAGVHFGHWFYSKWSRSLWIIEMPVLFSMLHLFPLSLFRSLFFSLRSSFSDTLISSLIISFRLTCGPVVSYVWLCDIWSGVLVNLVLSFGTDLAHITACCYCVWNLLCIETVIIYCRLSSLLPLWLFIYAAPPCLAKAEIQMHQISLL